MLNKRKFLISSLLSTLILTNTSLAQEVNCGPSGCYVNLNKVSSSKKHFRTSNNFKKITHPRFLQSIEHNELKVTHKETYIERVNLATNKYKQQKGEYLEPESELEKNTIILAPHKYVMTHEEKEKYDEQQNETENTILNENKPMSLYYCKNNSEPFYNYQIEKFQCVI